MKKNKILLPFLVVICLISVMIMIAVLQMNQNKKGAVFSPPPFDDMAKEGVPEVSKKLGYSELDTKAYKFAICGNLVLIQNHADVYLTNIEENDVWLKVRILAEDGTVLGETGLIKPGEYVQSVNLYDVPDKTVSIICKIMAYEPNTYYGEGSVTLNTTLTIEE